VFFSLFFFCFSSFLFFLFFFWFMFFFFFYYYYFLFFSLYRSCSSFSSSSSCFSPSIDSPFSSTVTRSLLHSTTGVICLSVYLSLGHVREPISRSATPCRVRQFVPPRKAAVCWVIHVLGHAQNWDEVLVDSSRPRGHIEDRNIRPWP